MVEKLSSGLEIPEEVISVRLALRLVRQDRERFRATIAAERFIWEHASEGRVKRYEKHLRPYLSAVRKAETGRTLALLEQHEVRIACAETHLPIRPLGANEFAEMITTARTSTLALIHPRLEEYLPDINANYRILIPGLA